ncbi:TonB-dependent receptor [Neptunicella sp. SCSIO 80796]|uniref:TonB-dependent receptor n=1 Tax=Neptunicella plasticusilytica TaxID=3117012 RepID=UPI003A4D2563
MKHKAITSTPLSRPSRVAAAISGILLANIGAVFAQDATQNTTDPNDVEVIQIQGIRGGVIAGLEVKRNSDVIVDAISAEDIGKFPDANLAEALQRIPEVSIDRDSGEGRFVTIRGLGPEFNSVLLNGRHVASTEPTRAFSFDTIAAELVSELKVYKTQNASLSEGGLGGTVSAITARPLSYDGLQIRGSIKAGYEAEAEKTTPQGSFLISNTFADRTIGALLAVSLQSRKNRVYQTNSSGIRTQGTFLSSYKSAYAYVAYTNLDYDAVYRPVEISRNVKDEDRDRLGISGVLQFRPNNNLDVTLDYLYSKFKVQSTTNQVSNWIGAVYAPSPYAGGQFGMPSESDMLTDISQTEVDENGVFTRISNGISWGTGQAYNRLDDFRDTTTQMLGANVSYAFSDDIKMNLDAAWSKAKDSNPGLNSRRSLEVINGETIVIDLSQDVPFITQTPDSFLAKPENAQNLRVRRQFDYGEDVDAENVDVKLDFVINSLKDLTVRTGFAYETAEKSSDTYETPDFVQTLYHQSTSTGTPFPDGGFEQISDGIMQVDSTKLGQPGSSNNDIFLINLDAFNALINDPQFASSVAEQYGSDPRRGANTLRNYQAFLDNGGFGAALTGDSFAVKEKVFSYYLEGAYDFEMAGMYGQFTVGARYTKTDLDAVGYSRVINDLSETPCDFNPQQTCLVPLYADPDGPEGLTRQALSNSYDNLLPSANLKLELTDDVVLRMAASKSMTRPFLEDMAPKFIPGTMNADLRVARSNNSELTPYMSFNLDASLEWYFATGSMASIAAYKKRIDDYIVRRTVDDVVVDSIANSAYNTFQVTMPSNAEDIEVSGISVNLTQVFDNGLGYQANHTFVNTDTEFDGTSFDETKPALPGLGDTTNVVVFYEDGPFGARLAYNKRKKFLANAQYASGYVFGEEFSEPVFAADYEQLDARVSYALFDGITVFVEGVNLTGETLRRHGRFENLFVDYSNFGKRYVLGLSGKW